MTYSAEAYFRDDEPTILTSAAEIDELIDTLLSAGPQYSVAALAIRERPRSELGLPDHEFELAVNADGKSGGLRYAGRRGEESGVWYAVGEQSGHEPLMYGHAGNETPFPSDSELPLDVVRAAAKEFLAIGGDRPSSVAWREWPQDIR
ncbi:Imm1 family immunity protein [Kribbella sp. NPDC002412]